MSHISRLEPDQTLDVFSYFTWQQLYDSKTVCKQWFHLYSHERLWKPVLDELMPLIGRVAQKQEYAATSSSKKLVLSLLKSHEVNANTVMKLIVSEDKLKLILNAPPYSLQQLKGMPDFLRSLAIWRGLSIDSTGLLKSLVDQVQIVALNCFCSPNRFFVDATGETHDSESPNIAEGPYTVMLFNFIRQPISPFDGGEMIRHLQSVASAPIPTFDKVVNLACTSIYDSHHKFPNLLAEPGFQLSE